MYIYIYINGSLFMRVPLFGVFEGKPTGAPPFWEVQPKKMTHSIPALGISAGSLRKNHQRQKSFQLNVVVKLVAGLGNPHCLKIGPLLFVLCRENTFVSKKRLGL